MFADESFVLRLDREVLSPWVVSQKVDWIVDSHCV